jgi:hypothetical protein
VLRVRITAAPGPSVECHFSAQSAAAAQPSSDPAAHQRWSRPGWWSLSASDRQRDSLEQLCRLVEVILGIDPQVLVGLHWLDDPTPAQERALEVRAVLGRWTRKASELALARLQADRVAVATRFAPQTRAFVYQQLGSDADGRLRKLVDLCPSLLTLVDGLPGGPAWLARLRDGDPLEALVDEALRAVALPAGRATAGDAAAEVASRVRLLRAAPAELDRQRLLLALAAPGVNADDLPDDPDHAQRWLCGVAEWGLVTRLHGQQRPHVPPPAGLDPDYVSSIGGFVSRNLLALEALAREDEIHWYYLLFALLHLARLGGQVATAASPMDEVMRAITRWQASLPTAATGPDGPLPIGPAISPPDPALALDPVKSFEDLRGWLPTFGRSLASALGRAAAGGMCFYRATYRDESLLVALWRFGGYCELADCLAPSGRTLSTDAGLALESWSYLVYAAERGV